MSGGDIRRASLDEIEEMNERGELFFDPNAPEGESVGEEFWARATLRMPVRPRSVHLKLDPEVFDYFFRENNGKGHLTKMQNVLRAYVDAHRVSR